MKSYYYFQVPCDSVYDTGPRGRGLYHHFHCYGNAPELGVAGRSGGLYPCVLPVLTQSLEGIVLMFSEYTQPSVLNNNSTYKLD